MQYEDHIRASLFVNVLFEGCNMKSTYVSVPINRTTSQGEGAWVAFQIPRPHRGIPSTTRLGTFVLNRLEVVSAKTVPRITALPVDIHDDVLGEETT